MEQFEGKNLLNFVKELPNDDKCRNIWQNIKGKTVLNAANVKAKKAV